MDCGTTETSQLPTILETNGTVLLIHCNVTIDDHNRILLQSALAKLPYGAIVIARVFLGGNPRKLVNGGYWWDHVDTCWRQLVMGEVRAESDNPIVEESHYPALGAVLMSGETAQLVGTFDLRFATNLADVDWLRRAQELGVPCFLVGNAKVFADPHIYPTQLGTTYAVIRDGFLLSLKHRSNWPFLLLRTMVRLIFTTWRPFDFIMSNDTSIPFVKRLVWAFSSYVDHLWKRMASRDSLDTLTALRDFLLHRFRISG